ncbi:MAG TPA: hypothetical protein VGF76_21940, partial [Polyangiaceae bacterium]
MKAAPAAAIAAAFWLCFACAPRAVPARAAVDASSAAEAPAAEASSATPGAPTSEPPLDDSGDTDSDSDSDTESEEGDSSQSAAPQSASTVPHPLDGWSEERIERAVST